MGSDPAPFIANLFLYVYEDKFLTKLKKSDLPRARKFRHVFRFIDDLISLNDDDEFLNSHHEIYPPEMKLKTENVYNQAATHLDLNLEIKDKVICSKLFDKRDAFSFSVVRMPYKCSNMPYKMFYSTISAEVLRICRATSKYESFLLSVAKLISRMIKQGAKTLNIRKIMMKMMSRHWQCFSKFGLTSEKIASDISSC